ncbi:MAG: metal dependent phosphohydrolase [Bryobacterales bacterium]|nr:metal dependent phosphohydrolase [Bryobacterales bacterium]
MPKDYDVATDAVPDQLQAIFPGARVVGAHFGVILVVEDGCFVEVATFRSDGVYSDGRHPDGVRFETDPRKDALRRDFTVNGLFLDPETNDVLDFTGGRADLAAGVIRTIGDPELRFREDHLRMLRAVRFAAVLGFEIEKTTFEAIRRYAASIHKISMERVRDEIARILTQANARRGFELLDATGLLHELLPEIEALKGVEQPPQYHPEGDVWTHTLMMLDALREPSIELALGVLLHDVGKPATFRIADRIRFDGHVEKGVEMGRAMLSRLKFPVAVIEAACALIANHMKFKDVPAMRESTLKRFLRMPKFDEHLELHRLDCLSSNGRFDSYNFARERLAETPEEVLRPVRLLSGNDLIAAGFTPGPKFSEVLSAVEDAQLEEKVQSREQALAMAQRLLSDSA